MKKREFEQAILKLAFESNAKLTQASVAYYLGIPSQKASQLLDQLAQQGVLELDSDKTGELFYYVPETKNRQTPSQSTELDEEAEKTDRESGEQEFSEPKKVEARCDEDTDHNLATIQAASTNNDATEKTADESESEGVELTARSTGQLDQGELSEASGRPEQESSNQRASIVVGEERIGDSEKNEGRTEVNKAVDSPVVEKRARCEPRPLKNDRPVVASCDEPTEESQQDSRNLPSQSVEKPPSKPPEESGSFTMPGPQARRNGPNWESNADGSNRYVPSEETRFSSLPFQRQKKHSHHPGMSLLLSLVLCGTGQIYNGEISKGVMMMILCFLMWFVLLGWIVHIWAIIDSVVVAENISKKGSTG